MTGVIIFGLLCALMITGMPISIALGLTVLAAHLVCNEWRNRNGLLFVIACLLVTVAVAGSWPLALHLRSPELFAQWWALVSLPQGGFGGNWGGFGGGTSGEGYK